MTKLQTFKMLHIKCAFFFFFFLGTTRNIFEGKKVIQLEYEAYVSMAESELKKIFKSIREKWSTVQHICVHHRLG